MNLKELKRSKKVADAKGSREVGVGPKSKKVKDESSNHEQLVDLIWDCMEGHPDGNSVEGEIGGKKVEVMTQSDGTVRVWIDDVESGV